MEKKELWEKGIDGKQKAKCPLFSIEVHFLYEGSFAKWFVYNQSYNETLQFRETVMTHGFFFQKSAVRGEIIFPWDLVKVMIDIQKGGWKETV